MDVAVAVGVAAAAAVAVGIAVDEWRLVATPVVGLHRLLLSQFADSASSSLRYLVQENPFIFTSIDYLVYKIFRSTIHLSMLFCCSSLQRTHIVLQKLIRKFLASDS